MTRPIFLVATLGVALLIGGCSSGDNPEYTTEVKMTEADKAKEKETMAGQQAPGAITPGQPVGTMPLPGNKRR